MPAGVGVGVVAFGVALARIAVKPAGRLRRLAAWVVAADLARVAASAALLTGSARPAAGKVTIAVVAAVAVALAGWQIAGIAAVRPDDPLATVEIVEASTVIAAPPPRIWPLLTDHGVYGRLAPNLAAVEVISEPGAPLRRRCTSNGGDSWEETCTLWDGGRRFAVEVDTTDYPYPLAVMRGLRRVDSTLMAASSRCDSPTRPPARSEAGCSRSCSVRCSHPSWPRSFRGWRTRLTVASPPTSTSS